MDPINMDNVSKPGETFPALFLDRDGVIIENREAYVRSWADVEIYPQALAALARIRSWPGRIVIITNQSVVGRGIIPLEVARAINRRLVEQIDRAGGRIDGVYMCPHAPQDECSCRKPQPGLLRQASQALSIDLQRSLMIGDALSDIQAGKAANVRETVLLRTGRGRAQERLNTTRSVEPFRVFDTLAEALEQLIAHPFPD